MNKRNRAMIAQHQAQIDQLKKLKWQNLTLQGKASKLSRNDATFHAIWLRTLPIIRNFNNEVDRLINSNIEYEKALDNIKALRSKTINVMPKSTEANHINIINELAAEFG